MIQEAQIMLHGLWNLKRHGFLFLLSTLDTMFDAMFRDS